MLTDTFVLELSFQRQMRPAPWAAPMRLPSPFWQSPATGQWVNAIMGNSDGGAGANFVPGAYNPATDYSLGTYGVDTADGYAWAVLDHNSFPMLVGNPSNPPFETIPEPYRVMPCSVFGGIGLIAFVKTAEFQPHGFKGWPRGVFAHPPIQRMQLLHLSHHRPHPKNAS